MRRRKLPQPPEETFLFSDSPKIRAEQKQLMEQTRSIMDERVAWNVTPEEAKKAQRATYNKSGTHLATKTDKRLKK